MVYGNTTRTIYAGGTFSVVQSRDCNGVASYNTLTRKWTCLGGSNVGDAQTVNTLAYHPFTKMLLAGGSNFFSLNGTDCQGVCIYNQGSWSDSGAEFGSTVNSIVANPTNNNWYVCGEFTSIDSLSRNYVSLWNGAQFVSMGQGFDATCFVLAWDSFSGRLYAGGNFLNSGATNTPYMAFWSGSTWNAPVASAPVVPDASVRAFYFLGDGSFIFGGEFATLGGLVAR